MTQVVKYTIKVKVIKHFFKLLSSEIMEQEKFRGEVDKIR